MSTDSTTYSRSYHEKHASDAGGKLAASLGALLCAIAGAVLSYLYMKGAALIISVVLVPVFVTLIIIQAKRFHHHYSRLN